MKLGLRILLGYVVIVALAAWVVFAVFAEQGKPGVRSTLEDTTVQPRQWRAEVVAGGREPQANRESRARQSQQRPDRQMRAGGVQQVHG